MILQNQSQPIKKQQKEHNPAEKKRGKKYQIKHLAAIIPGINVGSIFKQQCHNLITTHKN